MTANKHTPGPWSFYTEPQPNGCPVVGSKGLLVCMLGHSVRMPDQKETALANARLIAAAPELLEACQTFSEWLRREEAGFPAETRFDTPDGEAKWREWYFENLRICDLAQTLARAAIAKATGGAP